MQSPKGAFKHSRKKSPAMECKKLKDHLPFAWRFTKMPQTLPKNTKRTNLSNNIFWELLLVFQLFKQFDLEIQCFILKFQKPFSHRFKKNGYIFLHFHRVCRNEILYLDLTLLKWWYTLAGCGEIFRLLMSWFTELVLKYFWCCLGFDFMHKDMVKVEIHSKFCFLEIALWHVQICH